MRHFVPVLAVFIATGCNGCKKNPDEEEWGMDERPANPTCVAPDRPASGADVDFERVYPNVSFTEAVGLEQRPGDGSAWYVVEQSGRILTFDVDDATSSSTALDIRGRVSAGGEMGLLGLAFHPDFDDNGEIYVNYTAGSPRRSVVSRFWSDDGGATFDPDSEEVILELIQPAGNHNGGDVAFGPDGMLYTSFGDGGGAEDTFGNGQDPYTRLGTVLRIDVDGGDPWVPADNPFADGVDGDPLVYAWGLRNPWRISFDRVSGDLWTGDVGQYEWEEVEILLPGGNYGWPITEGFHCFAVDPCDDPLLIPPVAEYSHSEGAAVTGGFVYRGSEMPELVGSYVYTDFYTGRLWGVFYDDETGESVDEVIGQAGGLYIGVFGQDVDGELYVVDYYGGLYKLVPGAEATEDDFPTYLSETGCVDAADATLPAAGLIPYAVNHELWSDGAEKNRWMALPDGEAITVGGDGDWDFPNGTVLVKEFHVDGQLVETRLLVRHDDGGWAGYPYKWNDQGDDAVLVRSGASATVGSTHWEIPSSGQCTSCHTEVAGRSLGLSTPQLNGSFTYPGDRTANQIATLDHIGMFASSPGNPDDLAAYAPVSGGEGSVEERARAYLHVQCAHCHTEGGTAATDLDLHYDTPLADMAACNVDPDRGDLGVSGAKLITPGDPSASVISLRIRDTGGNRMPPLATDVVDTEGADAVDAWISGLTGCE